MVNPKSLPPRKIIFPILGTYFGFAAATFAILLLTGALPLSAALIISSLLFVFTATTSWSSHCR